MGDRRLKVVLFSGGRGTASISDALVKHPDIDLTILVNAYDDGLSTGLLRRFIPGMLGPSDVRKVVSGLLKHQKDGASQSLRTLLDYRFPDLIGADEAKARLGQIVSWQSEETLDDPLITAREHLSLGQLRQTARYLEAFLHYYQSAVLERPWFTFSDTSLGNLIFAGCYLLADRDFNRAIDQFSKYAGVGRCVINATCGENLVLVAVKEGGRYLPDEASVVGPQDPTAIEEIFLVRDYLDPVELEGLGHKEIIRRLRQVEVFPEINPAAMEVLGEADIIIYGPGTQHSSLFPTYLTTGLAEAVQSNARAEKVFIANIARDHDILGADAARLVQAFMSNMSRKGQCAIESQKLVSRFFFQKPGIAGQAGTDYLPFNSHAFGYPLDRVVCLDLEGHAGKHSGGRTVSEILLIVEEKLRARIRHVPHKVSIIVPALNEQRTIERVLWDLLNLQFSALGLEKEIIVVDGGSTDETYSLVHKHPGIRCFQVEVGKGRGEAYRLGLEKARGEIVVFFPADGEYQAEDIIRVVGPLASQEFPIVFGSRVFVGDPVDNLERVYGNRGARFLISKYGGMLLSILILLIYHRYIGDPLTTMKGFSARVFRGLEFQSAGVDFDMELIGKLAKEKYPILEIPVSYNARSMDQGKKITVFDGLKCLATLIRFSRRTPIRMQRRLAGPQPEASGTLASKPI